VEETLVTFAKVSRKNIKI